jgi:hypothetical protein
MDETMNTMQVGRAIPANSHPIPNRVLREFEQTPQTSPLSYIEPHEEREARQLIDKEFVAITGKPCGLRPGGYFVAVKIYIRPEELREVTREDGTKVTLYRPPVSVDGDKYTSCSALVVAMGPQAYKGKDLTGNDRFPEGPWCKVGDWIACPRHEAFAINYRGVAMALIPDDKVIAVIEDPTDVSPIDTTPRV